MSPAQGIRISVSLSALQFCFVSCWIATVCFCSRIRLYSFEPEAVLYVFSRPYLAHVVYCHWEEPGSFLTALQQWMFTSWNKPGMWFSKIDTSCSFLVLCAGVDWKHNLSLSYQTWRIKSVTYYECIVLGRKKKKGFTFSSSTLHIKNDALRCIQGPAASHVVITPAEQIYCLHSWLIHGVELAG